MAVYHDTEVVLDDVTLPPGGSRTIRHVFGSTIKVRKLKFPRNVGSVLRVLEFGLHSFAPGAPFALEDADPRLLPVAEKDQQLVLRLHNPSDAEVRFVLGADITIVGSAD